jgi:FKBP-type peptidyl-prolyl cis-trans isomerase
MKFNPLSLFVRCISGVVALAIFSLADAQEGQKSPELSAEQIKTNSSYALGLRTGSDFAKQFGRFGVEIDDLDFEAFHKGFRLAYEEKELPSSMTEKDLQDGMEAFGKLVQQREEKIAKQNKAAGVVFLEENGKRKGVATTESGLQYEVIEKGGDKKYEAPKDPQSPQKIFQVHYKGTLIDGTEFDASPEGEAVPMTLQVVPGFREALTSMPVGAKWKLFLSPDLAYGEQRASSKIAPNSTLIFDLKLEAIEDAPQPQGLPFQLPGQ